MWNVGHRAMVAWQPSTSEKKCPNAKGWSQPRGLMEDGRSQNTFTGHTGTDEVSRILRYICKYLCEKQ